MSGRSLALGTWLAASLCSATGSQGQNSVPVSAGAVVEERISGKEHPELIEDAVAIETFYALLRNLTPEKTPYFAAFLGMNADAVPKLITIAKAGQADFQRGTQAALAEICLSLDEKTRSGDSHATDPWVRLDEENANLKRAKEDHFQMEVISAFDIETYEYLQRWLAERVKPTITTVRLKRSTGDFGKAFCNAN